MGNKRIVRVLAFVLLIAALGLFLGTGSPTATKSGPYQSALTNVGVGTAFAAHGCNGRICEILQGIPACRFDGGGQVDCRISNGVCTSSPGCK